MVSLESPSSIEYGILIFKIIPLCKCFLCKLGRRFSNQGSINDRYCLQKKRDYIMVSFKLMVFMALTNYFHKIFMDFFRFAFISYTF